MAEIRCALVSGETAEVRLPELSRAAELKQRLRKQWPQFKATALKLFDGGRELSDADVLDGVREVLVVAGEASSCSVGEAMAAINETCASQGGSYANYSCEVVSWDDCCRSGIDGLSCSGPNITDSRLLDRAGQQLYTVRSNNWNERLGKVSADDVNVLVPDGEELKAVSLREYLRDLGTHGAYAGLAGGTSLDAEADQEVSIRFQTTFLPVLEDGAMEFCGEAYNYQTRSDQDPKNLVLLCTSQGTALQQHGAGRQKLFLHQLEDGRIARCWLEAQRTGHRVGQAQEESRESAEQSAQAFKKAKLEAQKMSEDAQAAPEAVREAELRAQQMGLEAAERLARAQEAEEAAKEGKAVARRFGLEAMGSRCNMLMTIQVPLEQKAPPPCFDFFFPPPSPPSIAGPVCGIDLGSSYCRAAIWQNQGVQVLPNTFGDRETPSILGFKDGELVVGEAANDLSGCTVSGIQRLLGLTWPEIEEQDFPFKVVRGEKDEPSICLQDGDEEKIFSAVELAALLLRNMKSVVTEYLGLETEVQVNAVLSVPHPATDATRAAVKLAAEAAGFIVMRIMNEPIAAAIACGLDKCPATERNVMVVDASGTCTKAALLCVEDGIFELRSCGVMSLGGDKVTEALVDHCCEELASKHGVDLRTSGRGRAMGRLRRECERVKRTLSHSLQSQVEVDEICEGLDFSCPMSRARLEELVRSRLQLVAPLLEQVLGELDKSEVHDVLLVGGAANTPKLRELVRDFFDKEPCAGVRAEEAVVSGNAIQAAILCGVGQHKVLDLLLLDVSPLSIGFESANGAMTRVIARNTTIPTRKTVTLTTHRDNQPSVTIRIYEGEAAQCQENHLLGSFVLGLPPMPKGGPQVEVSFEIDANGILHVTATEKSTGKSNQMTISNDKGRLSQAEIEQMIQASCGDGLAGSDELPSSEEGYGRANAARVSRGSVEDYWPGLATQPRRDEKQHCTITVQFYHTVTGGVPSPQDVLAAIDDMEQLYASCDWQGRLAEQGANFMKV